ncbi:hypothetical protein EMGBS2_02520 [Actinomycetota bacterium]|nr:hypothetical protein EMGBS2_02520 [Actinomycetota bacterium]
MKDLMISGKERKGLEEMRLAYVGITRAKKGLICSTSHFRSGANAVAPSELFEIFAAAAKNIAGALVLNDSPPPDGRNPMRDNPTTGIWPKENAQQKKLAELANLVQRATAFTQDEVERLITTLPRDSEQAGLLSDMKAIINEIQSKKDHLEIKLPNRLSVSTLLYLAKDPNELALRLRRPMPNHIDKYVRGGTEFHLWLEKHFNHPSLISMDDLFNQNNSPVASDVALDKLQTAWLASDWAEKEPIVIEVGFETMVGHILIRGRIDAIYQIDKDHFEVVDWKTGKVKDGEDLANAAIQLAMYRLAYAKLSNLPIENISAAFHYVADNQTIRVADVLDEPSLIDLITKIPLEV